MTTKSELHRTIRLLRQENDALVKANLRQAAIIGEWMRQPEPDYPQPRWKTKCLTCDGKGRVASPHPRFHAAFETCSVCNGKGWVRQSATRKRIATARQAREARQADKPQRGAIAHTARTLKDYDQHRTI